MWRSAVIHGSVGLAEQVAAGIEVWKQHSQSHCLNQLGSGPTGAEGGVAGQKAVIATATAVTEGDQFGVAAAAFTTFFASFHHDTRLRAELPYRSVMIALHFHLSLHYLCGG